MNQAVPATSTPGASLLPDGITVLTTAHLVLIGLLALLVVLGIVWGARQRARRKAAERELREYNAEVAASPAAPTTAIPASPAPVPAVTPDQVPVTPAQTVATPPADPVPPPGGDTGAATGPVTQLKGLGPKVAARLAELGITTVGQIAALSDDGAAELDAQLGAFRGRMGRDRWIEQARFLAAGDKAGFEAVFGRL